MIRVAFRVGSRVRTMYVPLQVAQVIHDRFFYSRTLVDPLNLMGSLYREVYLRTGITQTHEVVSGHPS